MIWDTAAILNENGAFLSSASSYVGTPADQLSRVFGLGTVYDASKPFKATYTLETADGSDATLLYEFLDMYEI